MIYNYRSSREVIAKVFRDFGINRTDYINDAVEWMGEALEHIGASRQTIPKIRVTKVENFRARIPEDLYILDTIAFANDNSDTEPDLEDFKYQLTQGPLHRHPGLWEENDQQISVTKRNEDFIVDGRYIKTSFEDYWIAIQYKAFYLDDCGYPMIPDDVSFREALSWYIMMKLLQRGENHPTIKWDIARQEWLKYCTQARSMANMPDKSQMKDFYKRWVTMIPNYDRGFEDFETEVTAENVIEESFTNKLIG